MSDMSQAEIDLLKRANEEIKNLRRITALQGARLKMFDDVMHLVNAEPQRFGMQSSGEDIVFNIEQAIKAAENISL